MYALHVADILDWCARYDGPPFHAILCDPPYHLTNRTPDVKQCKDCGHVLGGADGNPDYCPRCGGGLIYQRSEGGRGFMGKTWDGGDIAFRPETWAALAAHLLPGGFLMAFGGSRTFHRMACAIEDAGYILHPLIGYCFGSGFPKATLIRDDGMAAIGWHGHRYGLQALKPALEPICVAQKPYAGRPVDSITQTGAGALWIDGGRVATDGETIEYKSRLAKHMTDAHANEPEESSYHRPFYKGRPNRDEPQKSVSARWPANLALSHNPDCTPDACTPGCAVAEVARQSGTSKGMTGMSQHASGTNSVYGDYRRTAQSTVSDGTPDEGTAARYFHNADWALETAERIAGAVPFLYTAKAGTWEREAGIVGPEGERAEAMNSRCVNCGKGQPDGRRNGPCCDNPQYEAMPPSGGRLNVHPTVKPISLTHWLASLLLPPDAYAPRRLLIPFSGAGSEMIGAALAGWDFVQGVELMTEYAAIAYQRLDFWQQYAGLDWDAAQEYARAKQDALQREQRMDTSLDDLPLFAWGADETDEV